MILDGGAQPKGQSSNLLMVGNSKDKGQMNQGLMLGQEDSSSGEFFDAGASANFPSSSQVGSSAWLRSLGAANDEVFRQGNAQQLGLSLRQRLNGLPWPSFVCVKSPESANEQKSKPRNRFVGALLGRMQSNHLSLPSVSAMITRGTLNGVSLARALAWHARGISRICSSVI